MTPDDIRKAFLEELVSIAPDIDPDTLEGDEHLQDDLELDSMDILNLVTALHKRLGVSIAEEDYPRIETPDKAVAYLAQRLGG
ncbi:acyl carrier protein [Actibacterium sp. MT2.3-13A]|uniref:acyl carrier protein n=1 Tax=Actibacterium sp. MT2.3-13A TaxID=2828332 RepID=UPI001BA621AA|nr:acyl carrier protein [Actibacterium sp. MT2.3-13A]